MAFSAPGVCFSRHSSRLCSLGCQCRSLTGGFHPAVFLSVTSSDGPQAQPHPHPTLTFLAASSLPRLSPTLTYTTLEFFNIPPLCPPLVRSSLFSRPKAWPQPESLPFPSISSGLLDAVCPAPELAYVDPDSLLLAQN